MILYFNRTRNKFIENDVTRVDFYNSFFYDYNIDLTKCKFIHLYDDSLKDNYRSTIIFFQDNKIIIFKADLFEDFIPYQGYEVGIYLKKDIKSIKITSDNQYDPTYTFKIGFEKDIVEFTVKEQHSQNSDCKQATKFLTEYLK